jgi:Zn-dependent metalloprotease
MLIIKLLRKFARKLNIPTFNLHYFFVFRADFNKPPGYRFFQFKFNSFGMINKSAKENNFNVLRRQSSVKKILGILSVFAISLVIFGLVSKQTNASKNVFDKGSVDELENAKQISLGILRDRSARSAIGNVDEFRVTKVEIDSLKMAHTKVQQTVGDVPVWEGEAIVHLKADGSLSTVTDALHERIVVNMEPSLTKEDAISAATGNYAGEAKITESSKVDMWVFRGEDRDYLVYRVETPRVDGSKGTSAPVDFIDAHTGKRVWGYDNLKTATGTSLYSGTVTLNTSSVGGTFYLEDTTKKIGTFNMNSTGNESTGTGGTQSRYTDTDDVWNSSIQSAGVDAQYGAVKTFDYYQTVHGRNGVDGTGGPGTTTSAATGEAMIVSRVHFGSSGAYNNAFWFNNQMTYGDGDGSTFSPLVTLDVAGHEMTHGVTEKTANLTYARESGALNEGFSDVFGTMVERFARGVTNSDTWKIGEECYTPGTSGDALRYMANTHGNGTQTSGGDPDHYTERLYQGTCTPSNTNDQCGVHTNSGILNKAFYLSSEGGTHHVSGVTTTGMGPGDAEKIYYRGLSVYMTAGTNFAAARTALLNSATDLFGASSSQYNTIATAWCAVGVGACPTTGTPTPTPTPTPTGSNLLVNGGFETSKTPWVSSGTGAVYTASGTLGRTGTGYFSFGGGNNRTGTAYQTVAIPTTATGTLSFWMNTTSAETTTTTQYDKLFVEVRNTSGTLLATLATFSNLNKTPAGYQQKSLNLAAYKGQTVRVQFRTTNDSSLTTTFRVDDAVLQ